MDTSLSYLFDPLCGWCYGAGARLPQILDSTGLSLNLLPTGLFAGDGARPMDEQFATYAWGNDLRIARLTGQVFSERYREQVLLDRSQTLDSGPATVALTAVNRMAAEREFEALKAIQRARYVDGLNITRLDTLADVLANLGLSEVAASLAQPDEALLRATQDRVTRSQALLHSLGAQGVPTFILNEGGRSRLLPASAIFSNPDSFVRALNGAA